MTAQRFSSGWKRRSKGMKDLVACALLVLPAFALIALGIATGWLA